MHPLYEQAQRLSKVTVDSAITVHRHFGPGLLESIYDWALGVELADRGLCCEKQKVIRISYKGRSRTELLRCDHLVENCLLLEIKGVKEIEAAHEAQLLSYMRLLDVPLGLILNFHARTMHKGIRRLILSNASDPTDDPCGTSAETDCARIARDATSAK